MPPLAIGLSDYNHLRKMLGYTDIKLKNNEFTMQWLKLEDEKFIEEYIKEHATLQIKGHELRISSTPYYQESIGEYIYDSFIGGLIVLPDEWCKSLTLAAKDLYANTEKKLSFDESVQLEQEYIPNWFMKNYKNIVSKEYQNNPLTIRLKVAETNEILNITLGMRILGIYGGTVLLMISLTVLALQQLSDSIEHKGRYDTLRKLGIENKETRRIIFKQISLYFIIPIGLAIFGFYLFLHAFQTANRKIIDLYIGDNAFLFNISISLLLIILIYVCYFAATYYSFKRNVDCK
jgi:putative ABC transport system permease protein